MANRFNSYFLLEREVRQSGTQIAQSLLFFVDCVKKKRNKGFKIQFLSISIRRREIFLEEIEYFSKQIGESHLLNAEIVLYLSIICPLY